MPQQTCSYGNWLQWKSPVLPGDHYNWFVLCVSHLCCNTSVPALCLSWPLVHYRIHYIFAPKGRSRWWWIVSWLHLLFIDTARRWRNLLFHSCVVGWKPETPVWRQNTYNTWTYNPHIQQICQCESRETKICIYYVKNKQPSAWISFLLSQVLWRKDYVTGFSLYFWTDSFM